MHRSRVDDLAPSTPAPSDAPKPCTCRTGRSIYLIQKRNPHRQKCQQVQTYVKLIHIEIQKKKKLATSIILAKRAMTSESSPCLRWK
jgi:hypothetical protein